MKKMSFQEKWALLTKYENKPALTKKNIKSICVLANDKDALIRGRCAKLLANACASKAKHVLITLAGDKDALVRTEAYDSLSAFPSKHVQKVLKQAIVHEPNALARSYAILSWADVTQALGVHKKQKKFLKQLKKTAKNQEIRTLYAEFLLCKVCARAQKVSQKAACFSQQLGLSNLLLCSQFVMGYCVTGKQTIYKTGVGTAASAGSLRFCQRKCSGTAAIHKNSINHKIPN